jgi:hypothetical protein
MNTEVLHWLVLHILVGGVVKPAAVFSLDVAIKRQVIFKIITFNILSIKEW